MNGRQLSIYSLACDEDFGFAAFFMEKYGTAQAIVTNPSDMEMKRKEGFEITSCAAWGSTFFIIMTKDTEEYRGRDQIWLVSSSTCTWWAIYSKINAQSKAGYTVTGICYSTSLKQYFVVMTKIPEIQSSHYFDDQTAVLDWIE